MELTAQERDAVENGEVVKFVIPSSHVQCVLVREDLLFRLRADYSPCDPDDLSAMTAEVLEDEDWTR